MFPLVAIGGVIGAAISIAKGASWVAEQLDSTQTSGSAGGKGEAKAAAPSFATALAAQVAGQSVPPAATSAATSTTMIPQSHTADYDALARMKAGVLAYSHVGQHHGNHHPKSSPAAGEDSSVTRS